MLVSLPVDEKKEALQDKPLDSTLFHEISLGNLEAFHVLYTQTSQSVYGFLLSILQNKEDAEDLMQETYIKIRENSHSYKDQGKPLAWILTIARNLAYMRLREQKKSSFLTLEEVNISLDFSHVTNTEDRMVLEAAFRILNREERQIVILHAVSGLRHREISNILHKPLPTILSKYNRALKKLKKELTEREEQNARKRN